MKTTTPGQRAQDPNRPLTLAEAYQRIDQLADALEITDSASQHSFHAIQTVADMATLALESPAAHSEHNDEMLPEALALIHFLAAEGLNSVNCTAGQYGCNFVSQPQRDRATARRAARAAAQARHTD